jgi:RimJ/RimL family protein N-acetyltransferase
VALPSLETPRLLLRPATAGDAPLLHRHWTDPDVRRYLWDGRIIDFEMAERVARQSAESRASGCGLWMVLATEDGAFRGVVGLRETPQGPPELLYSVSPVHWGLGIATEAARGVLSHAFTALGLPMVSASTDRPNAASRRVLEKLGFTATGEALLHGLPIVQYAISREQFPAARSPGTLPWTSGRRCGGGADGCLETW